MNKLALFIFSVLLVSSAVFGQTKIFSFENNIGIVEENGVVTLWENQIDGFGNATQTNPTLGGEKLLETYPGKVNIGFSREGSFLELEGSNTTISDNSYSLFYVGIANPVGKPASLIGNYDVPGNFNNCSGIRFLKLADNRIAFDYAKPNYVRVILNTIPGDGYFFFGFTMDASGNYKYFDNTSPDIKTGKISNTMVPSQNEDLKFNLFEERDGSHTYNHTEVVEMSMFDDTLSITEFENEYSRLTNAYPELVTSEFSVTKVLPIDDDFREGIAADASIVVTFDQSIDETSDYPKVFINKSETEASGNWVLSPANVLTFTPTENWPAMALVTLKIQEGLRSTENAIIGLAQRDTYNFIVDAAETYAFESYQLEEPIASLDYVARTGESIIGHKLPIKITTPVINENTTAKFPVHIFVHGGGWIGGTFETSSADYSLHKDYLAKSLGMVTLSISYRCVSSGGTFSYALEDLNRAYQWAIDNAETYNLDMTKVFFSGGSAGTPLAALASQRLPNILGFIGFNGIYDFVNDTGDYGAGNWYKQDIPSETENSAVFQLSEQPPATILMHGDGDTTISHTQSTRFSDAIIAKGGNAKTIIYPGEVHSFFSRGKPAHEDVFYEMAKFITERLEEANLSINETHKKETEIRVYPNPLKKGTALNISLQSNFNSEVIQCQIINQLGQVVLEASIKSLEKPKLFSLDTSSLNDGYYMLRVTSSNMTDTIQFIID
ncbi:alpha/beta hydrolase fold domain-containing protein [Flavicella sediminum]|uniref:alpha/beta hydrolase fold domain-containing protein n=1 Tax=Flavicella sediminum TaxID=2585141 RepID=UPI001121906D|nr:alpha/beta hydrolase fold domain-containing protein [Flavicella sediminum]